MAIVQDLKHFVKQMMYLQSLNKQKRLLLKVLDTIFNKLIKAVQAIFRTPKTKQKASILICLEAFIKCNISIRQKWKN
jgi:hypothetical protein